MPCPSWQRHRNGSSWSPVWNLPVAPLWCDPGFFPNSRGNKAAANLRPTYCFITLIPWWYNCSHPYHYYWLWNLQMYISAVCVCLSYHGNSMRNRQLNVHNSSWCLKWCLQTGSKSSSTKDQRLQPNKLQIGHTYYQNLAFWYLHLSTVVMQRKLLHILKQTHSPLV